MSEPAKPDPPAEPAADPKYVTQEQLDAKINPLDAKLDQVLSAMGGGGGEPAAGEPAAGKSIADQVREGVEQLRREDAASAERDAAATDAKTWREQTEQRLKAVEEKPPREPAGRIRTAVQKYGLGIREPGR